MFESLNNPATQAIVDRHFFFIDSSDASLNEVKTHMYGFCIDGDKIFDGKTDDFEPSLDKVYDGSFLFVQKSDGRITVKQDYIGSYGLFLFRHENYFALSNSFVLLVDKIKNNFPLTLNEDYINFILALGTSSLSVTETPIMEISMLPRNYTVSIDIEKKQLALIPIKYDEQSVPVDSAEGLRLVDEWVQRWGIIIKRLVDEGKTINMDLTGGMDTRIVFVLLLMSGADLSRINFICRDHAYVRKERKHISDEDVEIASRIAERYGFSISRKNPPPREGRDLTVEEIVNDFFHIKMGFHENLFSTGDCHSETLYHFGGCGDLRGTWNEFSPPRFIQSRGKAANVFKSTNFVGSVVRVLQKSFDDITKLYLAEGRNGSLTGMNLYKETRNRVHFGRTLAVEYISNVFRLEPLMDYQMNKIRLSTDRYSDPQLLFALIFIRYQKELLNFKIQGKRSFKRETLELAQKINEEFPLQRAVTAWHGKPEESSSSLKENKSIEPSDQKISPMTEARKYMLDLSRTSKFRGVFTSRFSEEIYWKAQQFATENWDGAAPLYRLTPLIATVKALTDIDIGRRAAEARQHNAEKIRRDREFLFA